MNRFVSLVLMLLLVCGFWPQAAPATDTGLPFRTIQARLLRVIDGDSILVLEQNGKKRNIRLAGIDAPESRQAYGEKSKDSLRRIIKDHPLRLRVTKKDRYGRLIATVMAGTTNAGLAQLKAGYAWHYKRFRREQSLADRQAYEAAERRARQLSRGLWQQADPIAPWEYRRSHKRRR